MRAAPVRRDPSLAGVSSSALAGRRALSGCAHNGAPAPRRAVARVVSEAGRIGRIAYEDDFTEARLIFQALPANAPERAALRSKLLHYLLDPVLALNPADAAPRGARPRERRRLRRHLRIVPRRAGALRPGGALERSRRASREGAGAAASRRRELVVTVFSPRGGDQQVTLALAALATMAPASARMAGPAGPGGALDRGGERARRARRPRGAPAPSTCWRARSATGPRRRWSSGWTPCTSNDSSASSSGLRRPGGGESARRALGELLLAHGEEIQRAVVSMAGVYLRAGLIGEAARRTAVAGRTDRRRSRSARACWWRRPSPDAAAADYLALARRFLPRIELLGGTATEAPDPIVALRVLEAGHRAPPGRRRAAGALEPRRAPAVVVLPGDSPPGRSAAGPRAHAGRRRADGRASLPS